MDMVTIRQETIADIAAREALLDDAFGAGRAAKTAERLREGRLPADRLSLVATDRGRVVGTVRLWHITVGPERPALLLGPITVAAAQRSRGIGAALMWRAMRDARRLGHGAMLLVGDAPYYGRFGFSSEKTGDLRLPGPYVRERLLGCELAPGALEGVRGLVGAAGAMQPQPALAELVAAIEASTLPQAA